MKKNKKEQIEKRIVDDELKDNRKNIQKTDIKVYYSEEEIKDFLKHKYTNEFEKRMNEDGVRKIALTDNFILYHIQDIYNILVDEITKEKK